MAQTPTGTLFSVATAFGVPKNVTGISNAVQATVTAPGHTFVNGDVIEISTGWGRLHKRVFEIGSVALDTFVLLKGDTTSLEFFPIGSSSGSARKVSSWQQLQKVMNPTSSGGEPKKVTYRFVESDVEYSLNDGFSATSMTLELDDDDTTSGYAALRTLTDVQTDTVMKMLLKNGSRIYLPGTVALNDFPSLQDGQINKMRVAFDGNNRQTRYSAT